MQLASDCNARAGQFINRLKAKTEKIAEEKYGTVHYILGEKGKLVVSTKQRSNLALVIWRM